MSATYVDGPVSDHFDGQRFSNLYAPTIDRGLPDLWRWRRQRARASWPPPLTTAVTDHPPSRTAALRVVLIGHASLLIQVDDYNLLIDPVWSQRASPVPFAGPRRHTPPGIAWPDLPPIDAVLITHSHYDHLDMPTLTRLWARDRPRLIAPLGNDVVIHRHLATARVEVGDWWDRITLSPALTVTFAPANHWSARGLSDRRKALWCGYLLHTSTGPLYLAGDTAYGDGRLFTTIRDRLGAPLLAVFPIGAYEPRWFMATQHMNPEEAVRAFHDCGASQALGVHWGCFQLTDEARDAPATALATARTRHHIPPDQFPALTPGQPWPPTSPTRG